jgi:16S rRNA (cytidine1402-2'-O)-methyltransferase
LSEAELILCEDTRKLAKLRELVGFAAPARVLADYNEAGAIDRLVAELASGKNVALTSDGGTPLISDPGFKLVRAALEAGIVVDAIPGPSAPINALALSGLPPYPFAFLGYIPKKAGDAARWLERYRDLGMTCVIFNTPHRVVADVQAIEDVWGDRDAALCREMTKLHQEVIRDKLSAIRAELSKRDKVKGEITLVVAGGKVSEEAELEKAITLARKLHERGLSSKDAANIAAEEYDVSKNEVYREIVK